jgi:hypothetical protein
MAFSLILVVLIVAFLRTTYRFELRQLGQVAGVCQRKTKSDLVG